MDLRLEGLRAFVKSATSSEAALLPLNGDASFRRYFRVAGLGQIAVDAPPGTQKNHEFVAIAKALYEQGIAVPQVLACDFDQGYLLLSDLGDTTFAKVAVGERAEYWYDQAVTLLPAIANCQGLTLPEFDTDFMQMELGIFTEWLLDKTLHLTLSAQDEAQLKAQFALLVSRILKQPYGCMHRDYHSRNLMVAAQDKLAVIDFQDMVRGPLTYDLASLVYDCYIKLPESLVERELARAYRLYQEQGLVNSQLAYAQFVEYVRLCSLQRHLKVLGIFCRLHLRDHKSAYLGDLPRVLDYALAESAQSAEFKFLHDFLVNRIQGKLPCVP
ncbi:MAG: phosphotransferase [Succinivibrio sp.]|nr:phosphotransferase [Succinivibrio sp.]